MLRHVQFLINRLAEFEKKPLPEGLGISCKTYFF